MKRQLPKRCTGVASLLILSVLGTVTFAQQESAEGPPAVQTAAQPTTDPTSSSAPGNKVAAATVAEMTIVNRPDGSAIAEVVVDLSKRNAATEIVIPRSELLSEVLIGLDTDKWPVSFDIAGDPPAAEHSGGRVIISRLKDPELSERLAQFKKDGVEVRVEYAGDDKVETAVGNVSDTGNAGAASPTPATAPQITLNRQGQPAIKIDRSRIILIAPVTASKTRTLFVREEAKRLRFLQRSNAWTLNYQVVVEKLSKGDERVFTAKLQALFENPTTLPLKDVSVILKRDGIREVFTTMVVSAPARHAIKTSLVETRSVSIAYPNLPLFSTESASSVKSPQYVLELINQKGNPDLSAGHWSFFGDINGGTASSRLGDFDLPEIPSRDNVIRDIGRLDIEPSIVYQHPSRVFIPLATERLIEVTDTQLTAVGRPTDIEMGQLEFQDRIELKVTNLSTTSLPFHIVAGFDKARSFLANTQTQAAANASKKPILLGRINGFPLKRDEGQLLFVDRDSRGSRIDLREISEDDLTDFARRSQSTSVASRLRMLSDLKKKTSHRKAVGEAYQLQYERSLFLIDALARLPYSSQVDRRRSKAFELVSTLEKEIEKNNISVENLQAEFDILTID